MGIKKTDRKTYKTYGSHTDRLYASVNYTFILSLPYCKKYNIFLSNENSIG